METWDDDEEDRLEHLLLAKQRGKGAPKKKRTADGESLCLLLLDCVCVRKRHANLWVFRKQEDKGEEEACGCSHCAKGIEVLARLILHFRTA